LETQPLDTCRMREMSQGRAPECASSTIFCRVESGRGRPLTNTPPSWFTPLCPAGGWATNTVEQLQLGQEAGLRGCGAESTRQKNYSQVSCGILGKNGQFCNSFVDQLMKSFIAVFMCTALSARIVASVLNISSLGLSPTTKLHVTGHLPVLITDVNITICYYKD